MNQWWDDDMIDDGDDSNLSTHIIECGVNSVIKKRSEYQMAEIIHPFLP
uniref:Uncharacterized protein n=1 Tax=Nelumbo nucifera TaxID=4432 RepID=A0A822Y162_NELNU|nr:TPA_asm: hypothetical protein HUJ06_027665 [Nelumbo nucifera]